MRLRSLPVAPCHLAGLSGNGSGSFAENHRGIGSLPFNAENKDALPRSSHG